MKKACVIGWPISHSRSPLIHRYWLGLHGIDGIYNRDPVEPQDLRRAVATLASRGYIGCNVTIPHKEAVFTLVKIADEATGRLGVVNTVFIENGIAYGTSTDGEGFIANLVSAVPDFSVGNRRVVMLGAGGAAAAVAGALRDAGATEIAVANRTAARVDMLRRKFGDAVVPVDWEDRDAALSECSLLVNATALGMTGQPPLDIDLTRLPEDAVVTDLVYAPLETTLLKEARLRGNTTVPGLGMLLHQAVRGFTLWFGVKPAVTRELYSLVARDIDPDYVA